MVVLTANCKGDKNERFYRFETYSKWKNNYRIKETTTESGETVYWIENLKGLVFDSRKEAEEFCLVSFCNNFNLDMFS